MLVVGTDDGGLYHGLAENLKRAASLQYQLNRTYPTLMRPALIYGPSVLISMQRTARFWWR